jgi:hypothetical protein
MRKAHRAHLLNLLEQNAALKNRGFTLSRTPTGSIIVDRWGHVHGIWDFDGRCYTWTCPSSREPIFRTDSPNSAVVYTLVALTQGCTGPMAGL